MAGQVERLALRRFRGATTLTELAFDPGTPLVVVFGANGAGKSTIIDGVDLVCNKEPGSVRDRSSTNARQHLPAIGHRAADLSVEITCDGKQWRGTHTSRGIAVEGPGEPPRAHVLRRHDLLQLVEATPGDRYEALRRFIDVRGVERAEQALKDAQNAAGRALEEETRRAEDAASALRDLWVAEGRPGPDGGTALDWAAQKATGDAAALQRLVGEMEVVTQRLEDAARAGDAASSAAVEARRAAADEERLDRQIAVSEGAEAGSRARTIDLLRRAAECIAPPYDGGECPVCRQPVAAARLRADIAERLAGMAALAALQAQRESAEREREHASAMLASSRAAFIASARRLAEAVRASQTGDVAQLRLSWDHYARLMDVNTPDADWALCEAGDLLAATRDAGPVLARVKDDARADLGRFNAIRQHYERIGGASERVRCHQTRHERLTKAWEIAHAQRIAFTQGVLDGVAEECNRLYARIHPKESLGGFRLFLDENRRASLQQDGTFEGYPQVPPQAYFSEAHLDTLGFCLFLALARAFSGGAAILALDDVFTSADEEHLGRIFELLREESTRFRQVIVATHHPSWRQFRQDAGVQWIHLRPWSREQGIGTAA